jgi:hypothetical protein
MDRPRDQLLTRAALAANEDGDVAVGDLLDDQATWRIAGLSPQPMNASL